ncbi:TatD family hydrolase [Halobacteriovorax sp. HLS]|uniref:TatD family hydrolase n=1 Tax=Halobacteriovorax sp. HLS TaxID=2234000 RepID=UPI000FD9160B|nr:TatD family hydrolase [Halobacteriovorax sp. HLS]
MHLNFHTHILSNHDEVIDFYSIDLKKGPAEFLKGKYQCLGIHPWDLTEEYLEKLSSFEYIMLEADVLCLGEMGIDRTSKDISIELQKKVFLFQLNVAAKRGDSFVIIHCVKAYNEIIECYKKSKFKGKLVFHDYNGDENTTKDLIKRGCYFSYGNMLFFPNSKGYRSLNSIPIERLFLETDDHRRFSIFDAYEKLASIKKLEEGELITQILANFDRLKST